MTNQALDFVDTLATDEVLDALDSSVVVGRPRTLPAVTSDAFAAYPDPVRLADARPCAPVEFLADSFLLARTIGLFVGPDGAFKTTLLLAILVAIAGGLPVFGAFATGSPKPVLFVSGEDDIDIILNRVEAIIRGMGWEASRDCILNNFQIHALVPNLLLDCSGTATHLLSMQEIHGYAAIAFDPVPDLLAGSEDSARDARPVKSLWRALMASGAAIFAAFHFGKPKERQARGDRLRGSSAWKAASRTMYVVVPQEGGVRLECEKMSRMPKPSPFAVSVNVDTDPGNPLSWHSARIRVDVAPPLGMRGLQELSGSERTALECLAKFGDVGASNGTWLKSSQLKHTNFNETRKRLLSWGHARGKEVGKRMGKSVWNYSITCSGIAVLTSDSADSAPSAAASTRTRETPECAEYTTPYGGESRHGLEADREYGRFGGAPESFDPAGEAYFASLLADSPR